jgi:hypothetical protein
MVENIKMKQSNSVYFFMMKNNTDLIHFVIYI